MSRGAERWWAPPRPNDLRECSAPIGRLRPAKALIDKDCCTPHPSAPATPSYASLGAEPTSSQQRLPGVDKQDHNRTQDGGRWAQRRTRRGPRSNPRHQGAGVQDVHVLAIGLDTQRGTPLLLVAEQTGRRRALPLSIGIAEALAIQLALRGIRPPRPPTHQLIAEVITALGTQLDHVEITALRDNIFYADLVFTADVRISARPSDAIALALQTNRPIRATDELLDLVGTTAFTLDPAVADPEAEITRFRQELDRIDPDDFTSG